MIQPQDRKLVLVVDDTPANIGVITGLLRDTYRTKVATSGERALAIAAQDDRPDLILLDVMMPEMDGYEVCRRLKADAATREIPVVFLTAMTTAEDEALGFAVGGVDYIHKPFSAPIMLARVKTHLDLQAALAQARAERATLSRVMEGMTDGLLAVRADGTLEYFNKRAGELLRCDLHALTGRPILEVIDRAAREHADADAARSALSRLVADVQDRPVADLVLPGPPRLEVQVRSFPLGEDAFGAVGLLVHDVTPDREAARAKDEMMRLVSHELRSPLNNLLGFTDMMLMRDFPRADQEKFLSTMLSEEERLTALINDFLDLERLAAGFVRINQQPLDPSVIIQRAVAAAGPDEDHPMLVRVPAEVPRVLADEGRIMQVLTNLISNARKYSPEGGEVRIAAVESGGFVDISVHDQGLGLPPEAQQQLFQKFYRIERQEHQQIKGTGLGLAICRQIIEAHGGRIWAVSPGSGRGSTFSFSLPIALTP